ncbi:MAG TPA: hypothetical protein VGO90_05495 [Chthoniobacteraceae bacterium]|jgi:hypothetical protein|nr:hypothetical protein [Chthoniobacter sp.]HEV7867113.1 hypothetical protein [Chthoniobacteraceae bacterium]
MKPKPLLLSLLGSAAALALLFLPQASVGQAGGDDPQLAPVLLEISKQQTQITENHRKIEEKVALIAEDVRLARIFVGRGGGKNTTP